MRLRKQHSGCARGYVLRWSHSILIIGPTTHQLAAGEQQQHALMHARRQQVEACSELRRMRP